MSDASAGASSPRGARGVELGYLALLLAFVVGHGALLPSLQHLIDEGTNVYSARLIQQGQVPFRDFLYHQPPLYLYLLALLPTDHFVWGRAVSLLAACGSGRVLLLIARALLPAGSVSALIPSLLFYFAALQYYGLMALPNACMLFFALLGTHLIFYARQRRVLAGALAIVVAVLFKPIAIPVIFAMLLALAVAPDRRRDAVHFALAIGAGGALSWAGLHWSSDGAFTDLVRAQSARYAEQGVLDQLKRLPQLREDLGDFSSITLNLAYHIESFWGVAVLLWALLVPGLITTWRRRARFSETDCVLWSAWLLFCTASVLFVWDVSWPHYHLLYLPPLALFGATALDVAIQRGRIGAIAVICVCLFYALGGLGTLLAKQQDYAPVLALRGETAPLLAFDPTVNVLSRTESACGLVNHLAQLSGVFHGGAFARFGVDPARCLDDSPETKVVIHRLSDTSLLFVDRPLFDAIRRLPPERVVYLDDGAREAFEALPRLLREAP